MAYTFSQPKLRRVFLWLLLSCAWLEGELRGAEASLEAGHPSVQSFVARDYRADNQVWSATQDADGVMYFGNKGVVLEYDGATWRKIVINDSHYDIRGLANDPVSRTVYVGGMDDLGFLKDSADGEKVFVSLLDRLPAPDRKFGSIFRVFATPEGVFFIGIQQVMRWRDGSFTLWKFSSQDRLQSQYAGGHLYIQSPGLGLLRLTGEQFAPASDDPFLRTTTFSGLAPGPGGSLVLGARHDGAFVFRDGALAPLDTDLNGFFKKNEVRNFLRLRNGSLAVATGAAGVILLGADNRFRDRWDAASGLQNQIILNLFEDREGGVWLCSYAGITRVQTGSAISIFDASNGLKRTSVHDILRYRGTLYLGTDSGLYHLVKSDPASGQPARFERVAGMDGDYWGLAGVNQGLIVTGLGTIYVLDDNSKATLIGQFLYSGAAVWRSQCRPGRIFLGTRADLRSLAFDESTRRWADEGPIPGLAAEIHTCVESSNGDLWVGSIDRGLFRVRLAPDGVDGRRGAATITSFFGKPGPLADAVAVRVSQLSGGEVIASTSKGLYQFDPVTQNFRLAREYGLPFTDGSFAVDHFVPDGRGNVWLTGRLTKTPWLDQQGALVRAGNLDGKGSRLTNLPRQIFDKLNNIDVVFPEADGALWLASPDGVIRLDARAWQAEQKPAAFRTLIRRASAISLATSHSAATVPLDLATPATTQLDSAHASVTFELAGATYAPGADLLYRTRLRGLGDGQWSAPEARTRVEFTNLPAGHYVFEARAENADGVAGEIAQASFVIAPAWQHTAWAYTLYVLLAGLAVTGAVRWRLAQLRAANARLEALVATRTNELRAQQIELERAKNAADESSRAKSTFLANMSHELRTPLNAVLGYTQIMLNDAGLSPRNRERLTVVGHSGNHLLSMINEVLDISKIEAGKLTLDPLDFDLEGLLAEVAAAFAQRVAEKGLRFEQELRGPRPGFVYGDAGKLRQILFNLLGNAVKFTQKGAVRLSVEGLANHLWLFEVSDTGVGVSESDRENLFIAFYQGSAGKTSSQGTGLGLAISQRLVELLGGKLNFESDLGQGSRFWFEVRLPGAMAPASPAASLPAERSRERIKGYCGARRRLLVADDEPVNRQIVREMLEPLGFQVEEAATGAEALEKSGGEPLDALVLDLRMAPVDGFEVARRLRLQNGKANRIKIVAVSASVFESDRQQAVAAGCDDFLPKPFREEQLLATLGRLLCLEWVTVAGAGVNPPEQEIDAMIELSQRGDIRGIKQRLSALLAAGGSQDYSGFVRRMEPLVAGFQMDRIRDILIRCKVHGNAPD